MKFYRIGGAVRDEFIGRPCKDIDFAVEGVDSLVGLERELESLGYKIHITTAKYLTIRAKVPEDSPLREITKDADFTLCRTEGEYLDGRHPEQVEVGTIEQDLARRDFTMNAIAIDALSGDVLDPFGGRADIERGLIRCVGSAAERILEEDSLRALRALRFASQLGFDLDDDILDCLASPKLPPLVMKLSIERIYEELRKAFREDPVGGLERFIDYTTHELRKAIFRDRMWLEPHLGE